MRVKRAALFRRFALVLIFLGMGFLGRQVGVWGAASGNAGKLLITEVAFRATGGDWAELYVVDGAVGWSGSKIYKGGTVRFTIPITWENNGLTTGDYIVLQDAAGCTDDVQKSDNNVGYWDGCLSSGFVNTDDVAQIKDASDKRVDVVIWSNNNGSFSQSVSEANGAVSDGMWDNYDFSTGDAGAWTDSDDIGSSDSLARYLDPGAPVYADSDKKTDWYHETSPTEGTQNSDTVVELAFFTATPHLGCVRLAWATDSEIDNEGFNVWRSDAADGEYTQLNAALIPAQGGPTWGASYAYDDTTVTDGVTYHYKLEDVDTHGASTFHGPVSATPERVYRLYLPLLLRNAPP